MEGIASPNECDIQLYIYSTFGEAFHVNLTIYIVD